MQKIYGIMFDCGDGSATLRWYRSKERGEWMQEEMAKESK